MCLPCIATSVSAVCRAPHRVCVLDWQTVAIHHRFYKASYSTRIWNTFSTTARFLSALYQRIKPEFLLSARGFSHSRFYDFLIQRASTCGPCGYSNIEKTRQTRHAFAVDHVLHIKLDYLIIVTALEIILV